MSELTLLLSTINLKISILVSDQKIILHAVTACKKITDKIAIFYKYKISIVNTLFKDVFI